MTGVDELDYVFAASERPWLPGAPFNPRQSPVARLGYTAVAILAGGHPVHAMFARFPNVSC